MDVGSVRIGVAVSEGSLALAHDTVLMDESAPSRVAEIANAAGAEKIYVGLPLSLSGDRTKSSDMAIDFARSLTKQTDLEIMMIDERLSTVSSQRLLREAGKSTRDTKTLIDAESARSILAFALESPGAAKSLGELDA